MGKDNTIKTIRIRTGNSVIEGPIQLLYPMELHCDAKTIITNTQDKKNIER